MMKFGLEEKTIKQINQILAGYPQIKKAIIYGSRAKGNFKTGSDIDITIEGRELNLRLLNKVSHDLDELLLPYTFDLTIYSHIKNPDLLGHIKRVGTVFYEK